MNECFVSQQLVVCDVRVVVKLRWLQFQLFKMRSIDTETWYTYEVVDHTAVTSLLYCLISLKRADTAIQLVVG